MKIENIDQDNYMTVKSQWAKDVEVLSAFEEMLKALEIPFRSERQFGKKASIKLIYKPEIVTKAMEMFRYKGLI